MTITDVYLEEEHFNQTAFATIPGAWVAIVNGIKRPFARPHEFSTSGEAMEAARGLFL